MHIREALVDFSMLGSELLSPVLMMSLGLTGGHLDVLGVPEM